MKRKRMNLQWKPSAEVIRSPAFPWPGFKVFEQLRTALSRDYGDKLITLEQLAFMLQVSVSTVHDWFRTAPLAQVQALLCLLERLPAQDRERTLNAYLREYPSLQHPRLAHDPGNVRALETLLLERAGLSVLHGGTRHDRDFLVTAIGHAFHRVDPLHRNPAGLDLREPRKFVPVIGVVYFAQSVLSPRFRQLLPELWVEILNSHTPLVLLSGALSMAPEMLPKILAVAATRHIIIADDQPPTPHQLLEVPADLKRVVRLSKVSHAPSLLRITIEALGF